MYDIYIHAHTHSYAYIYIYIYIYIYKHPVYNAHIHETFHTHTHTHTHIITYLHPNKSTRRFVMHTPLLELRVSPDLHHTMPELRKIIKSLFKECTHHMDIKVVKEMSTNFEELQAMWPVIEKVLTSVAMHSVDLVNIASYIFTTKYPNM